MVIDFQWRKNTLGLCSDRQISDFFIWLKFNCFLKSEPKKDMKPSLQTHMCSHTYVVWNPINFKIWIDHFRSLFPHIAYYVTFTVTNSERVHESAVKMPLVSPALTRFHDRQKQRQNSQFFLSSLSTLTAALGCYMRKSGIVLMLTSSQWQPM